MIANGKGNAPYTPTPTQIREACIRIQATWTQNEHKRHVPTAYRNTPFEPPTVSLIEMPGGFVPVEGEE